MCHFQADQRAPESAVRWRADFRSVRFLPLQRYQLVIAEIPAQRNGSVMVGKRAMLDRVGGKLVKYDAQSKGALGIESNRRAVKQDAVLAFHQVRFEAVARDFAELQIGPLLPRQKTVGAPERIDGPDELAGEVFREGAVIQGLSRHGIDHGK